MDWAETTARRNEKHLSVGILFFILEAWRLYKDSMIDIFQVLPSQVIWRVDWSIHFLGKFSSRRNTVWNTTMICGALRCVIYMLSYSQETGPCSSLPDSRVHEANMGPTWVLSAPGGPHVGPMNLDIWVHFCPHNDWMIWPEGRFK